jgi:hypothetical protein
VALKGKIGKATKFTFVTVPLNVVGWNYNKKLFLWLRAFWTRSVNPDCPECNKGVLICDQNYDPSGHTQNVKGTQTLFAWVCTDCNYALLESKNPKVVRNAVAAIRQQQAKAAFSEMEQAELQRLAMGHRRGSRIFYAAALLTFANFARLLSTDAPIMFSTNWLCFAIMFWVFGMKRAYRCWQVSEGHLFQAGAFRHWFKQGKWLI